jgi:hypothetical protein
MKASLSGVELFLVSNHFILHPSAFILKVVDTLRGENIFSNEGRVYAAGEV